MTPATVTGARRTPGRRAAIPAAPRRSPAPRGPRRVSGPIPDGPRVQRVPHRSLPLGARALAVIRSLPDRSLVDRLVRGRAWIPVLGVLLAGIVAMQVEILKLGTRVGRSVQRSTALQSQNELLQAGVAGLADDQRIERLAAGMGMVMPTPGEMVFLPASAGQRVARALGNIHSPDPSGFAAGLESLLAAQAASTAAQPGASTGQGAGAGTQPAGSAAQGAAPSATAVPGASAPVASAAATTSASPATSSSSSTAPAPQSAATPSYAPAPQAGAAAPSPPGAAAPAPPSSTGG